jgi:hypothetical protein
MSTSTTAGTATVAFPSSYPIACCTIAYTIACTIACTIAYTIACTIA